MITRRRQHRLAEQGLLERRIVAYLRSLPSGQGASQRQIALDLGGTQQYGALSAR